MTAIELTGRLMCTDESQDIVVRQHLPRHIDLTRAEPGCLRFDVTEADDPHVWNVHEIFVDAAAFTAHQERVAASEWGRVTAGIEREYTVHALDADGERRSADRRDEEKDRSLPTSGTADRARRRRRQDEMGSELARGLTREEESWLDADAE